MASAPSQCTVAARDTTAVLSAIANTRARCHLSADTPVYNCYEAGRDGFWLHRWNFFQRIAALAAMRGTRLCKRIHDRRRLSFRQKNESKPEPAAVNNRCNPLSTRIFMRKP